MDTTRKMITVTDRQDNWIKAQIAAIRAALIEGEESGDPQPFDSIQFKQEMAVKYADKIR